MEVQRGRRIFVGSAIQEYARNFDADLRCMDAAVLAMDQAIQVEWSLFRESRVYPNEFLDFLSARSSYIGQQLSA